MIQYSLIAAVPDNWVIGNGLKIPWYIPEDFKLFKEKTKDSVVIMGKLTWDSLPIKPLPGRVNIILNKELIKIENAIVCTSINQALETANKYNKEIFCMGGSSIYKQMITDATYLYISHIKGEFEGNIFFPKFNPKKYEIVEEKKFEKFTFKKYKKRK